MPWTTTISPNGCEYPDWIDDDYCDDDNNNEECEWDGGDCCGSNVNTDYCIDCECLDPDDDGSLTTKLHPNTLFRNKRFALNKMFQRNASKICYISCIGKPV